MHEAHGARGLQILANPCNQFGGQEPAPEAEIKEWVTNKYGVQFPLLGKCDVKGNGQSAMYQYLATQAANAEIRWNFAKFLLNKNGEVVKFYEHGVDPADMLPDIEALLNEQ